MAGEMLNFILEKIKYLGCRRCRAFAQEVAQGEHDMARGHLPLPNLVINSKPFIHSPQLPQYSILCNLPSLAH